MGIKEIAWIRLTSFSDIGKDVTDGNVVYFDDVVDGVSKFVKPTAILKDVIKNSEIVIDKGYSKNNVHHQYYHIPMLKMRELKKKWYKKPKSKKKE